MIRPGNALLDAFIAGPDRAVQKWIDYFDAYDRLLSPWRGRALTFLEIGVQNGGSLMMWRDYLGPEARIIGVDVDPNCRAMTEHGFEIWIGDQGDPAFWEQFKAAVPSIDVVLDDGGHTMRQQLVTFDALFPIVSNGGLFIVEDTHTSYFPSHGGGAPGHPGTWMGKVKDLIDQMHAWYHAPIDKADQVMAAVTIPSITIFDSLVAIEKRRRSPPIALARGDGGHQKNPPAMDYIAMRRALRVPDQGV